MQAIAAVAALAAGLAGSDVNARIVVDEVFIRSESTISARAGAVMLTTIQDIEERHSATGLTGVGSEARYVRPPVGASTFPDLVTRGTQTMQGLNRVDLTAPGIGLFNQVQSVESTTLWDSRVRNALLPPVTLPVAADMEFTIFGGELAFECYNCFLAPTTVTIGAYIYFIEAGGSPLPAPAWSYEATLTSNGFATPSLNVVSTDPQGIGTPTGTIVHDALVGPKFAYTLDPFTGALTMPILDPDESLDVLYRMTVRASGDLSLEGNIRASLGDPFSVGGAEVPLRLAGQSIEALLSPVPEPNGYAMWLAGIGVLGAMARRCSGPRKRRRNAAGATTLS